MARVPLYKTTETEMIRRIRAGEWAVGLRLPNEFELADEFGVSQGTMRRALITLEGMGLLHRKPGRGTEVCAQAPGQAQSAAPQPNARLQDKAGQPPIFEVFRANQATRGADATELALFGTPRLAMLERILRRDGARAALDEITVPEALIPALDEDAAPDLAELLEDAGLSVARIDDHVTAALTTMSESVALSCDRHTALLVLTRTARDAQGAAIARQRLRVIAEGIGYGA
jgi:GntR family transcriptional regulator